MAPLQMWDTFKEDGNAEAYTDTLVKTFRAISEPLLRNRLGLNDATVEVRTQVTRSVPYVLHYGADDSMPHSSSRPVDTMHDACCPGLIQGMDGD